MKSLRIIWTDHLSGCGHLKNEKGALIQHFEAVDEHEEANYIVSSMKK